MKLRLAIHTWMLAAVAGGCLLTSRIYPGADGNFTLYSDDGRTYAYERGITHLHWDDAAHKLTHTGAAAWSGPDAELIDVVLPKSM